MTFPKPKQDGSKLCKRHTHTHTHTHHIHERLKYNTFNWKDASLDTNNNTAKGKVYAVLKSLNFSNVITVIVCKG